jgi:hypothetical protein
MNKPLNTKAGYYSRFIQYVGVGFSHKMAWEMTQDDFEKLYGIPEIKGYSSLESFKNQLSAWFKGEK